MAESSKNYFDSLPDEIILKILENMDGMTDKSKMEQVSSRFHELANDKKWRKSIYISKKEFQRFSTDEGTRSLCLDTILEEINRSEFFGLLTIDLPMTINEYGTRDLLLFEKIDENLSRSSKYVGGCKLYTSINITHVMFLFTPNNEDADYGRTLRYNYTNTTSLTFRGNDIMMLVKILKNCKETLLELKYEGKVTLPLLRQLGKCKKLYNIILNGPFNLPNDVNDTELPKIRSEVVYLKDFQLSEITMETSYKIRDIFFSDALHSLEISFYLFRGVESEICTICPNLRYLNIQQNTILPSKDIFADFCDNLLLHLNNHLLMYEVRFHCLDSSLKTILSESRNRNLTVNYRVYQYFTHCLIFSRERDWSLPSMFLKH